ncbi:YPDG domain-containing protein [Corynebacterium pseudogenitalium]|uniref:YPDG domain-containing protein n=1 Tax=Corynebacterium pseudogenitalium TaxID=38303 RepID=UPI00210E869B|nr:YPDG domain-containing protein [Corynebacterium pseudogenitalium]UUA87413.1 YPDG domain-containing protein [Corynebacterium pseudogenitalium]
MRNRRMSATVVALALGASALVVPQVDAQSAEENRCHDVLSANTLFPHQHVGAVTTPNEGSFETGTRVVNEQGQVEVYYWVSLHGDGEHAVDSMVSELRMNQTGISDFEETFTLSAVSVGETIPGAVRSGEDSTTNMDLNVTGTAHVEPVELHLSEGSPVVSAKVTLEDVKDIKEGETRTFAWVARSVGNGYENFPNRLGFEARNIAEVDLLPVPAENAQCFPLQAAQDEVPVVTANGKEFATNIQVTNGAGEDYARVIAVVTRNGKAVEGANARVDKDGRVHVTLPVGGTGEIDNEKPEALQVEVYATPRDGSDQLNLQKYKDNAKIGETFQLKTQQWAPSYGNEKTSPGKTATVALKPGSPKYPDGTTFEVIGATPSSEARPWDVTLEEGSNALKVTAPISARLEDTVTVQVKATYPDGSHDVLESVVGVDTTLAQEHTPGYDVVITRPSVTVTLPQVRDQELPADTTFKIAPDQQLGDWTVGVDKRTGEITATPPANARDGETKTINVEVTFPDGSTKVVPGTVIVSAPPQAQNPDAYYLAETTRPGVEVTVDAPEFSADAPKGTTFTIHGAYEAPKGWEVTVGKDGSVTATPPADAKPGDRIVVPVQITYPDGSSITRPAVVVVVDDAPKGTNDVQFPPKPTKPGTVVVVTPKGGTEGSTYVVEQKDIPEGWTINIDENTGVAHVTPPADAKPGDFGVINVQVTDPNGNTITRPIVVTVIDDPAAPVDPNPATPSAPDQNYAPKQTKPNQTVTVNPTPRAPGGTAFVISPEYKAPKGWKVTVGEDGSVTATPPADAKSGDYTVVPVDITYPGGQKVTRPATILVVDDADTPEGQPPVDYNPGRTKGGVTVVVPPSTQPDGATFKIVDGWKAPEGWSVTINDGGSVSVTPPADAKPGDQIVVPVEVTYPGGKTVTRPAVVTVSDDTPSTSGGNTPPTIEVKPGTSHVEVHVPGANIGDLKLPDGWTAQREGDKVIIVPPAERTPDPKGFDITIPGREGDVTVHVVVQGEDQPKTPGKSSTDDLQRCFADMSSHGGPLLWLIPLGLAVAVGAPLIAAMGPEISASARRVSEQMNIPNPFGNFGDNRPDFLKQLDIEAARLNAKFGPQATEALGAIAAVTLGIGALAGLLSLCAPGENGAANKIQQSSNEGSSLGDFLGRKPSTTATATTSAEPTTTENK